MTNKLNSLVHTKQNGYVVMYEPYCIYSKIKYFAEVIGLIKKYKFFSKKYCFL